MADEHRVTRPAPADRTAVAAPGDPAAAREQIEATRARISDTIDQLEDAILLKRAAIRERLDVLAPVRERPLRTLGIVLGVGVVLGWLTGGDDRDEDEEELARREKAVLNARARALLWETRARRLLREAQDREEELEMLRLERETAARWPEPEEYDEEEELHLAAPDADEDYEDYEDLEEEEEDYEDEEEDYEGEGEPDEEEDGDSLLERVRHFVGEHVPHRREPGGLERLRRLLDR